jgi:hypothetical protein
MNQNEIDLAARISLHEFLLEQAFANQAAHANDPERQWDLFSKAFVDKVKFKTTPLPSSPDEHAVRQRMIELAEKFCEKVAVRIDQGFQ